MENTLPTFFKLLMPVASFCRRWASKLGLEFTPTLIKVIMVRMIVIKMMMIMMIMNDDDESNNDRINKKKICM